MQMRRGCVALIPREPDAMGTDTCTNTVCWRVQCRGGWGEDKKEEEEEEEPQKAWIQAQLCHQLPA